MVPPSSRQNPGVVTGKLAYTKRRIASCNSLATIEGIMPPHPAARGNGGWRAAASSALPETTQTA